MSEQNRKEQWLSDEQKDKINTMYQEGVLTYSQIAQRVGRSRSCVVSYIRRAVNRGEIKGRDIELSNKLKGSLSKRAGARTIPPGMIYEPDGIVVNCTASVAKRCLYGSCDPNYLCDFFAVTGRTRYLISPHPSECTCFTSKKGKRVEKRFSDPYDREYYKEAGK